MKWFKSNHFVLCLLHYQLHHRDFGQKTPFYSSPKSLHDWLINPFHNEALASNYWADALVPLLKPSLCIEPSWIFPQPLTVGVDLWVVINEPLTFFGHSLAKCSRIYNGNKLLLISNTRFGSFSHNVHNLKYQGLWWDLSHYPVIRTTDDLDFFLF